MPSSLPNEDKLLRDVLEHEAKLSLAHLTLSQYKEDLAKYDSMDQKFMEGIKFFYEARYALSRDISNLVMLKAEFGIVGKQWYNKNTKS